MKDSQASSLSRNLDHATENSTETFPLKLIFKILLGLPAKSLVRFKSVSKQWHSIIQSRKFSDAFLAQLSRTRPRLLSPCPLNTTNKTTTTTPPQLSHDMTISDLRYRNIDDEGI
ncbi:unnamed protein product [Microthlaspi erraticum]|uniref:F-box domain-containing protein n=1 Tax=Microthlaspi erraticum TaxID=1685480 RepID=A0A6D2IJA4_9BRAS|nr:unnamed protein product [Microthlaspi erraticum]